MAGKQEHEFRNTNLSLSCCVCSMFSPIAGVQTLSLRGPSLQFKQISTKTRPDPAARRVINLCGKLRKVAKGPANT